MKPSDFDYELSAELIAQRPLEERDASRLLLLERRKGRWEDHSFRELPELLRGDEILVVNNARVLPARLLGRREGVRSQPVGRHYPARREYLTAGIEVMLTRCLEADQWEALVRPGRKIRTGERLVFGEGELVADVIGRGDCGARRLRFSEQGDLLAILERIGHIPLPPYIRRPDEPADRERYQTMFAAEPGAVAAPTAGLHFTPQVVERIRARGAELCEITLRVGLGTFQPIHSEEIEQHEMHSEPYTIPERAAAYIREARRAGRPVLAVGTTVVRALEDAAEKSAAAGREPLPEPGVAEAEIFIRPGHRFRVVDQLLTNFHLPRSSLLVMVAVFAGREQILAAYRHAVEQRYRFYSYGDCMLIR
jgi:S-adenosylmethionine:tRNA ribosyltransferase-isomerase